MQDIVETLDVSKLSGWLNADRSCRVERRVYKVVACTGKARLEVGHRARTERTRNMEYMFHVRALALDLQPSPSLHVANTAAAHRPAASARTSPRFV